MKWDLNPRRMNVKRKADQMEDIENKIEVKSKNAKIKCICHKITNKKNLIKCSLCSTSQHLKCVFKQSIVSDEEVREYLCPLCWKSSQKPVEAKTTFIATPASIKSQWKDEINRHISDKSFKVLMYDGIANGWVSPTELAKYDAIITDFNILSKELYFSETSSRSLRHDKKFEYPPSPLCFVRWWRVVLGLLYLHRYLNNES